MSMKAISLNALVNVAKEFEIEWRKGRQRKRAA
jgi:hypothetical protein